MLLLRRIRSPIFCFSSTFCTRVHCNNLSAQRKWWMSWMPERIHWVTNHGIFLLYILHVFKIHCPGCQQKSLFVSRTVIYLHRIMCSADSDCFKAVNTIKCNSPPLENTLIYLAFTRAWSEFYLFLCPNSIFVMVKFVTLGLNEHTIYCRKNVLQQSSLNPLVFVQVLIY